MSKAIKLFSSLFPLWVIIFAAIAYFYPQQVLELKLGQYLSYLLGLVMLGVGLTMSPNDFKMIATKPWLIALGILLRTLLMPLIAFSLAHLLRLPNDIAIGLILVGCCPSGTASNIMTFIAKGDTALSVTLTSAITLLAPILTPITFFILAGSFIEVDKFKMFLDIVLIVILPVAVGVLLHIALPKAVDKLQPFLPIISIIAIVIIIMAVVAGTASKIATMGIITVVAVALHNALGLTLGYAFSRLFKLTIPQSRAVAFEIGMENSGLAVVLASSALGNPLAALPGAIFSVWHNLTGSLLAGYWSGKPTKEK